MRFSQDVARRDQPPRRRKATTRSAGSGRAFNQMLDRLDDSKVAMVRNEKLALAGLFAARVAHDIRNPLASIKIHTQLLESAREGRRRRTPRLVNAMLHDISQVESVIRDLIELAQAGRAAARAR